MFEQGSAINSYQQIYMLFYAVLFGVNLNNILGFKPFQFRAFAGPKSYSNCLLKKRLFLGFFILNILPLAVFSAQLYLLEGWGNTCKGGLGYLKVFMAGFAAMTAFFPYRLWHYIFAVGVRAVIERPKSKLRSWWILYTRTEYKQIIKERGLRTDAPHGKVAIGYLIFPCAFLIAWRC